MILNAGNCEYLDFPNPDWAAVRRVMEVNYFGTVNCVELALPLLRASKRGRPQLVVVASQVDRRAVSASPRPMVRRKPHCNTFVTVYALTWQRKILMSAW